MNDIKVGDKLEIHCYKHNGKIDRISGEALVLDVAEDYLVCANNKVKITESDGKTHRTKETAILFFYKNEWFNILAQLKKFVQFLDRIPTEEGPVNYSDGAAKRIVHFNGKDISELRKSIQENIDAIQNELETFAALTQI